MKTFRLLNTFSAVLALFDEDGNEAGEQDGRFEEGQEIRAELVSRIVNEAGNPALTLQLPCGSLVDLPERAVVMN